jgi:O-antigen ligase
VFGYPNALGLYLGPLVLLFLGCAAALAAEKKWSKILKDYKIATLFAAAAFSIAAIVFAKSAGAFFAVAAGLVVFGLLAGKKPRLATVLLIIIAAAGIFSVPKAREAVLKEIILKDFSGQVRRQQWSETWAMLQDGRLFFGAGLANYQKAFAPYHAGGFYYNRDNDPEFMRKIVVWGPTYWKKVWQPVEIYMYPHNIFLNFWSELGLLGLLLFVLIIVKFFILGGKLITDHGSQITDRFFIAGLIGAMVVVVIHGLVDVPYFKNDLAVMFWLFLAMMGAAGIALKPDEKKNLK